MIDSSSSPKPTRLHWRKYLVGFLLLVPYFYTVFSGIERNSDNTGNYYAGVDWFRGNWNLKNWVLPPDNFLNSDLLLYGLLSKIFGVRIEVCYYSAAIIWAGILTLSVMLTRKLAPREFKGVATLSTLLVLGLPVLEGNPELGLLSFSPLHLGSILYLAAACACLHAYFKGGSKWLLVAYSALLGFDCFGDPMIIVLGALPALVAGAYHLFLCGGKEARLWRFLIATFGAIVGGKALLFLMKYHGFKSPPLPLAFVSFDRFNLNFSIVARGAFVFAGADFWGHTITRQSLPLILIMLLHLPLIIFQLACLCEQTFVKAKSVFQTLDQGKQLGEDSTPLQSLLYFIILFTLGAALTSNAVQDMGSLRYILPEFIFLNILTAARCCRYRTYAVYIKTCLAATLVFSLITYLPRLGASPKRAPDEQQGIVWKLQELNLRDGFGFYWDASLTTVLSRDQLLTRPLSFVPETGLHPYMWTSTADWFKQNSYSQTEFFVITRPPDKPEYVTRKQAIETFGPPKREVGVWSTTILIYDRAESEQLLKRFELEAQDQVDRI